MASYVLKNAIHTAVCKSLMADIQTQRNAYYYFVGGLQLPGVTYPTDADDSYAYELNARNNIIGMKKINAPDVSFVLPRINWVTGTVYDQYDDYTPTYLAASGASSIETAQFYVVTTNNNVYKCLFNNNSAKSTVMPTNTGAAAFYTADGYRWKYMYTIPLSQSNRFMNNAFIPVQTALTDQFYSSGQLSNIVILSGGQNYVQSSTSIVIDGDGTGAILTPVVSNGAITQVVITNAGTGYTYANLTVAGAGTGASIVANLSVGDLDTAQADIELLAVRGALEAYRITNPGSGYNATGVPATGAADGVSTVYQLTDGGMTVAPQIGVEPTLYKTNWQGKQQLYFTPRTNLFQYTGTLANAYWGKTQTTIVDGNAQGPDGNATSASTATLSASTTNSYFGYVETPPQPHQNQTFTFSVYLKAGTLNVPVSVFLRDGADANVGEGVFNLSAGTSTGSAGTQSMVSMGNGWYRCIVSGTFAAGAANGLHCYIDPNDSSANSNQTYFVFGPQLESGSVATSYLLTPAATPTTRTDVLTLDASGRVTYGWVPSASDVMTWAGTYIGAFNQVVTVTNSNVVPLSSIVVPTVTVTGDGTGALAHPVVSNGQIVAILVDNPGQGYTWATITIKGNGSGAAAQAIMPPYGGHGHDAVRELFASQLAFFSNMMNDTNHGLQISNQFRQIGIIRNPSIYASDRVYSSLLASGCNLITFSGGAAPNQNDLLTERYSGSQFQVVQVSGNQILLQNINNYELPSDSVLINNNSGGEITALTVTDPDIDKFSGDLLFVDNFAINQQAGQQIIIFKTTLKF